MERESSKHGPRVDEQITHEVGPLVHGRPVEGHAREDLQQEGPVGHPANRPGGQGRPAGYGPDDVELRAALAASLRPSIFPADRALLLEVAQAEQSPGPVLDLLARLPTGIRWPSLEAVWEAAGGPHASG
ncbi:MAG: DUF2795 domain-containing protein [Acidimicrobiaceae bacterium]|nr:DUF2795 domain-containing protein [Acidimicrobiaceae bacterium]